MSGGSKVQDLLKTFNVEKAYRNIISTEVIAGGDSFSSPLR